MPSKFYKFFRPSSPEAAIQELYQRTMAQARQVIEEQYDSSGQKIIPIDTAFQNRLNGFGNNDISFSLRM